MSYPVPVNEAERLRTLRSYKILDTKPEERFDELTQLAALICDAPISLISLLDSDRQWFKSRFGLDLEETPRAQAFCTHAIMQPEMFVVPDAAKDKRFAQNPFVTGETHIRLYAGAPLAARDGHLLGTLCVMDRQPHALTDRQRRALEILSHLVIANIELRSDLKELRDALAVRDADEDSFAEADTGLEELISRLHDTLSDLQAARGRKKTPDI
jgi:two-component system NtrC family sensor kinase